MHLFKKKNVFLNFFIFILFFLRFRNLDLILNLFKKKMTLIADVFLNLQTPKYAFR